MLFRILNTGVRSGQYLLMVGICLSVLLIAGCAEEEIVPGDPTAEEKPKEAFGVARMTISTQNTRVVDSRKNWVDCSISLESKQDKWNYSGTGRIRGRGNSTWLWYPKKPYRIELDKKEGLLGLQKEKDWVLLADYRDPTHLMNTFVFTMGQALEIPFTNHSRYVELTLNDNYAGLYMLTEQVEQGKNRVAIDSAAGILLSLDADDGPHLAPDANDNFWSSVYRMPVCVKHPKKVTQNRLALIKNEFEILEKAIKNGDYHEVETLFDIETFIDYMIIQELVYNVEVAAPRSMYLHKDAGGRWTMGPLWDFDAGFDFDWSTMRTGHNYFKNHKELVLGTSPADHAGGYVVPSFFTDLFRNRQFVAQYKARWFEIRDNIMSDYWETTMYYAEGFAEAMERDAERWPIGKNHDAEVQRMRLWLNSRVGYLSTIIENYPEGSK